MTRETDLTAALQRNLDAAFPILVGAYDSDVYTLVLRAGADAATAEDIAAETFLRAYRALSGYTADRIGSLRVGPWLVTIALNTWRNEVRRRTRHPEAPLDDRQDPVAVDRGPEAEAVDALERESLQAALADLAEPQRLAVVMRHILGMRYREIAEVLSKPEGTVKSDVARGLAALRRRLQMREVSA